MPTLDEALTYSDWLDIGKAYFDRGDLDKAEALFSHAANLDGKPPHAWVNLSTVSKKKGRPQDAKNYADLAVFADKTCADAWRARSMAALDLDRFERAERDLEKALKLQPESPESLTAMAYLQIILGRYREALALYQRVVELNPYDWHARFSVTTTKMALGDWSPGTLAGYDIRPFIGGATVPQNGKPIWQGEDIAGKTILLCGEQGLGDLVMFLRYARLLKARGATVFVRVEPTWMDLCWHADGIDGVYDYKSDVLPEYDVHVSMMTCWRLLGVYDGAPAYLDFRAPKEFPHEMPTVGLCWRGQPKHQNDRFRSIFADKPLDFTGIDALPFSLAKGDNGIETPVQLAEAINACDLIITVDTAVAHIAGALGRPVWALLPLNADYRWLLTGNTTPWYPTMRLFRCMRPLDWEPVLNTVRAALITWRESWK